MNAQIAEMIFQSIAPLHITDRSTWILFYILICDIAQITEIGQ